MNKTSLLLIEKFKRFWKLYDELRRLRKKVETLEEDLGQANRRYNFLLQEVKQELPVSTMSVMIPNLYTMEGVLGYKDMDSRPRAEYVTKRMTDKMKIKLVDDLFNQGFIRKVRDDEYGEVYEVKLVRSEE